MDFIYDASGRKIPVGISRDQTADKSSQLISKAPDPLIVSGGAEGGYQSARENLKNVLAARSQSSRNQQQTRRPHPKVQKNTKFRDQAVMGKEYPGAHSLLTLRAIAWSSTVVFTILTYRRHQLTKKDLILVPRDEEPSFRFNVLEYTPSEVLRLPCFNESEKFALVDLFQKIDPFNEHQRKLKLFEQVKQDLSKSELGLLDYFNKKFLDFHSKRNADKRRVLDLLRDPDPYYSEESSWYYLLANVLEDLLLLDRGAAIKLRNDKGELVAIVPVDGVTIRPVVDEFGLIQHYTQVVDNEPTRERIDKKDVILLRMNLTPDVYMYGYGIPTMEVLYTTVLSDLYIDKGNLDYYRKGGSVPEGFLTVEPPGEMGDDGFVAMDREQLEAVQRQLQAIIMSDFTQIPVVSGGKFEWVSLKENRKDMQALELAEYQTRKICATFQVSPQDAGLLADVNRANAEVQSSLTKAKGLETLAATISHYFTTEIVDEIRTDRDLKLWFRDHDDLERKKEVTNIITQELNSGYKSINQALAEEGKDPVPWGDTPLQGLQNWVPMDEQQGMGGPGGAAGGPPTPPGLDQVAAVGGGPSPIPIPGQKEGESPALGQPGGGGDAVKSVLASLLATVEETYRDDLGGTVPPRLIPRDKELTKSLGVADDNVPTMDFGTYIDMYLDQTVKDVAIDVDDTLRLHLYLKVPRDINNRQTVFQVATYLLHYGDDYHFVPERGHQTLKLYGVTAKPPIGDPGSSLRRLTEFLAALSDFSVALHFISDEEFPAHATPFSDDTTVAKLVSRVEDATTISFLVGFLRDRDELCDRLLDRLTDLSERGKLTNPPFAVWNLATDDDRTDRVLALVEKNDADQGDYYRRFVKCQREHVGVTSFAKLADYPAHIYYDPTYQTRLHRWVEQYRDKRARHQVYPELIVRRLFEVGGILLTDLDPTEIVSSVFAHCPVLEREVGWEAAMERVHTFLAVDTKLANIFKKNLPDAIVATSGFDVFSHYSLRFDSLQPQDAFEEEIILALRESLDIAYACLTHYADEPFRKLETPLESLLLNVVHQSLLTLAQETNNLASAREAVQDLLWVNGVETDLVPVEDLYLDTYPEAEYMDLDAFLGVVGDYLAEMYFIDNVDLVKSLVAKLARDEELESAETTVLDVLKS